MEHTADFGASAEEDLCCSYFFAQYISFALSELYSTLSWERMEVAVNRMCTITASSSKQPPSRKCYSLHFIFRTCRDEAQMKPREPSQIFVELA